MLNIKETNLCFAGLESRVATQLIVIHHVGDIDRDVSAEEIHQWHQSQGWSGIGYHYVIRKDGAIERGRPEWAVGSHAYGRNRDSIGINIVGDFEQSTPTSEQIESAAQLLADICTRHGLVPDTQIIVGHRDLMATSCPGTNLYIMLQAIRGKAIWYQQQEV